CERECEGEEQSSDDQLPIDSLPDDLPENPLVDRHESAAPEDTGSRSSASVWHPSLASVGATPHTRGVLFRSAFRVLGARQGAALAAQASRGNPVLARALQPQSTLFSWHPTEAFVAMLRAVAESGREPHSFARELGRVATAETFSRFFGADPTAVSPWQVLAAVDLFWRRYHTWGAVRVERRGPTEAEISIAGGPAEPMVCSTTIGILSQVVLQTGAVGSTIEHSVCEAAGAVRGCVFSVRWQMPVSLQALTPS
ncbi:MAG: DUF2378 family protein, partial [Pseudomonadota bacterium]